MGVLGCLGRYNPALEPAGIPYSFECTVEGRFRDPGDARRLALEAVRKYLSPLLGNVEVGGFAGWEYIGSRFNLYSYRLHVKGVEAGVLRVVETGGAPLVVVAAIRSAALRVLPGLEVLREAGRVEAGDPMKGPVYLEPHGEGDEWPEGQKGIPRFVVYDAEGGAAYASGHLGRWRVIVEGVRRLEVEPGSPTRGVEADFHCVTGWSVRGVSWEGIPLASLLREAGIPQGARWVLLHTPKGYVTVIPLEEALRGDVILAFRANGAPLTPEHGGPVRLVAPRLYGWKSAKWVTRITLHEEYQDGYWEALAYHERGLVWAQERFKVRNPEVAREESLPSPPRPLKP